jgi:hypothetical protein
LTSNALAGASFAHRFIIGHVTNLEHIGDGQQITRCVVEFECAALDNDFLCSVASAIRVAIRGAKVRLFADNANRGKRGCCRCWN